MLKLIPTTLIVAFLIFNADGHYYPSVAKTCVAATSCGRQPLRFVPGQRITIEIANLTESVVQLQQPSHTDPVSISPGQVRSFVRGGTTEPNFSLVLWDVIGLPIKVNLLKPQARTLRIEVHPGGFPPGDRTVYLQDDGRVVVF